MFHEDLGYQFVGDLARFGLIVKFRDLRQRIGGEEPNLAGTRIVHAHEFEVSFHIACRHDSELLTAQRNAILRRSLRRGAESFEAAGESIVHHIFQLDGHLLAFGLAACGAHLQVLGSEIVVAVLRGLQESEHGTGRSRAIQWVGSRDGR